MLAEELRPGIRDTIAFLQREGIEIKVLSGDAPQTVAAIARDVGIPVAACATAPRSRPTRRRCGDSRST